MYKVIVFAGTTEGYGLCRFLGENQIPVLGCVATEYGAKSLQEGEFLHVRAGRLTRPEMEELLKRERPQLVLDATHPYAAEVTCIDHFAIVESCVFFSKLCFFCKLFETFKYVVIYLFCSIVICKTSSMTGPEK